MSLTNSTKPRPLAKMIENSEGLTSSIVGDNFKSKNGGQYIDSMDMLMLDCKSKIDLTYYKQALPR